MVKINHLFFLLFLCLISQSCFLADSSLLLDNNIPTPISSSMNVTPTPATTTTAPTPTYTATHTPSPVPTPTITPVPIYGTWKKSITITETSGNALTDYQVCIDLSTDNFNYSHVSGTNGEDLRFYANGTTVCPYWIQTWKSTTGTGSKSRIWVKIPSLAANGTTTLDMYYGTASATPLSDGYATMLLYDDFNDPLYNTFKWRDYSYYPAYITQSAGTMLLYNTNDSSTKYRGFVLSLDQFPKNISVDCYSKVGATSKGYFEGYLQCDGGTHTVPATPPYDDPPNTYHFSWATGGLAAGLYIYKNVGGLQTQLAKNPLGGDDKYHTISMQYFNTQLKFKSDGVELLSTTDTSIFTTNYIGFASRNSGTQAAGTIVTLDWVCVRKLVMPEPTVTLGTEQSYP